MLLWVARAAAFDCASSGPPRPSFDASAAVFVGTVAESRAGAVAVEGESVVWREPETLFVIERSWKGSARQGDRVEVTSRRGAALPAGARFLVYAFAAGEGRPLSTQCSRTRLAAEATLEIGLLDAIVKGGDAEAAATRRLTVSLREDPHEGVRAEAARLLGSEVPAEVSFAAIPDLVAALRDRHSMVRLAALGAIDRGPWIMVDEHTPVLARGVIPALGDPDPTVREAAATLLRKYRTVPETPPALDAALAAEPTRSEANARVVRALASSIAIAGARDSRRRVVLLLVADLAHAEAPVRMQAAQSLQTIGREAGAARLPLQKALADSDHFVRYYAADALGALGSREAVPSLVAALGDKDLDVRAQAASAIHRLGDLEVLRRRALPALVEPLARQSDFGLYHVLRVIGEIGPEARAAVPALRDLLKRAEPFMKPYVAEALGGIGPRAREAVPDLLPLVASATARTAQVTVTALGRIDDRAAPVVGAFVSRMKDGPEEVRLAAMMVLHRWRAPDALRHIESDLVPALVKRLGSADRDTRRDAAWRLHQWGGESAAAVPALVAALSDPDEWVRQHSAFSLGAIGPGSGPAVPGLVRLLADRTARVAAATSLGQIGRGAGAAVPVLLPLLEDPDVMLRSAAAEALNRIGTPEARAAFQAFAAREVPLLAGQLADPTRLEHGEAARQLVALAPATRGVMPVLMEAVRQDPDWLARTKSAEALGALGPLANAAVPTLAGVLADSSSWVREAASAALEQIGTPAARKALADFNVSYDK